MRGVMFGLLTASLLSGCAGVSSMSQAELSRYSTTELCAAYGGVYGGGWTNSNPDNVRHAIRRKDDIEQAEWSAIYKKQVFVGMSEAALLCSWGTPNFYGGVNQTRTSSVNRKQYVYRACSSCGANYVYVENGKVTGIQN